MKKYTIGLVAVILVVLASFFAVFNNKTDRAEILKGEIRAATLGFLEENDIELTNKDEFVLPVAFLTEFEYLKNFDEDCVDYSLVKITSDDQDVMLNCGEVTEAVKQEFMQVLFGVAFNNSLEQMDYTIVRSPTTLTTGHVVVTINTLGTPAEINTDGWRGVTLANGGTFFARVVRQNVTERTILTDIEDPYHIAEFDFVIDYLVMTDISTTAPTNQPVTVTLSVGEGLPPVKLPPQIDLELTTELEEALEDIAVWEVVDNTIVFTFKENTDGPITVTVFDTEGNETDVTFNVSNIDTTPPVVTPQYSITTPTNQPVRVTLTSDKDLRGISHWTGEYATGWTNPSGDLRRWIRDFDADVDTTIVVMDLVGNTTDVKITIENINTTSPEVTPSYSTTNPTNQPVLVTLTSTKALGNPSTWTTVADNSFLTGWSTADEGLTWTRTFTNNANITITVMDLHGNTADVNITISNIDTTGATVDVGYSTTELTNQDVLVTLTSNKDLRAISHWTGEYATGWTNPSGDLRVWERPFTADVDTTVVVMDLAGNTTNVNIKIENIDTDPAVITITPSHTYESNKNVTLTLTSNKDLRDVSHWTGNTEGWTRVNATTFTRVVTSNTTEPIVVTVKDLAGNETISEEVTVDNIDTTPIDLIVTPKADREPTDPEVITLTSGNNKTFETIEICTLVDEEWVCVEDTTFWTLEDNEYTGTFTSNTTMRIRVTDTSGNQATRDIVIDYIQQATIIELFGGNGTPLLPHPQANTNDLVRVVLSGNLDIKAIEILLPERNGERLNLNISMTDFDVYQVDKLALVLSRANDRLLWNGRYTVTLTNETGYTTSINFVIGRDIIESSVSGRPTGINNQPITWTIKTIAGATSVVDIDDLDDEEIWRRRDANTFERVFKENVTNHEVLVTDEYGNTQTVLITIGNINTERPDLEVTMTPPGPTHTAEDVEVTIESDKELIELVEVCTLVDDEWDCEEDTDSWTFTSTTEFTRTFTNNVNMTIRVTDTHGNQARENIVIDYIRRTTTIDTDVVDGIAEITVGGHLEGLRVFLRRPEAAGTPREIEITSLFENTNTVELSIAQTIWNGEYRVRVVNNTGFEVTDTFTLNRRLIDIETTGPNRENDKTTNEDVIWRINTVNPVEIFLDYPEGIVTWVASNNNKTWTARFVENFDKEDYVVILFDEDGNKDTISFRVENIDKMPIDLRVRYEEDRKSTDPEVVTLTSRNNKTFKTIEICTLVDGECNWVEDDTFWTLENNVYTGTFTENATMKIKVTDTSGNYQEYTIEIDYIEQITTVDIRAGNNAIITPPPAVHSNSIIRVLVGGYLEGISITVTYPYREGEVNVQTFTEADLVLFGGSQALVLSEANGRLARWGTYKVEVTNDTGYEIEFEFEVKRTIVESQESDRPVDVHRDPVEITLTTLSNIASIVDLDDLDDEEEWEITGNRIAVRTFHENVENHRVRVTDIHGNREIIEINITNINTTPPVVDPATYNPEKGEYTDEDVVVTLTSNKALGNPSTWTTADNSFLTGCSTGDEGLTWTRAFTNNANITITVMDTHGNTTPVSINVDHIRKPSTIEIDGDDPVIITIGGYQGGLTVTLIRPERPDLEREIDITDLLDLGTSTIELSKAQTIWNGDYTVKVVNSTGATVEEEFTIDRPVVESYDPDRTTTLVDPITWTITTYADVDTIESLTDPSRPWTQKDDDNLRVWEKEFTTPVDDYEVKVTDINGNYQTVKFNVINIDTLKPIVTNIERSPSTTTTSNVEVTVTVNREINTPSGWIAGPNNTFTRLFTQNDTVPFIMQTPSGWSETDNITVSNINRVPTVNFFGGNGTGLFPYPTGNNNETVRIVVGNFVEDLKIVVTFPDGTSEEFTNTTTVENTEVLILSRLENIDSDRNLRWNGTYTVEVTNSATTEPVTGKFVIKRPIVSNIEQDTYEPTNGSVTMTITTIENIKSIVSLDEPIEPWTFTDNEATRPFNNGVTDHRVEVTDIYDNTEIIRFTISNIDRTPPVAVVSKTPSGWTSESVTITITSNKDLNGIVQRCTEADDDGVCINWVDDTANWTLSANARTISRNFADNVDEFEVRVRDLAGNPSNPVKVEVKNIDRVPLVASVGYSTTAQTRGPVTAIITTNKPITTPEGWTRVSDTEYTREYTENTQLAGENITLNDAVNNVEVVTVLIRNIDRVAPVITINGQNPIIIPIGVPYTDEGATALDDVDGVVTVTVQNNVNVNVAGTYTVVYTARDRAGNEARKERTVIVRQPTAGEFFRNASNCGETGVCMNTANTNNFVWYSGHLWRVIQINDDGTLQMITEDSISGFSYGPTGVFSTSFVKDWLNNNFYNSLNNSAAIVSSATYCESPFSGTMTMDNVRTTCPQGHQVQARVGLLTLDQYVLLGGSSSYLSTGDTFFTMTPNVDFIWAVESPGVADVWFARAPLGVRPVITVKDDVVVRSGAGTRANPYRFSNDFSAGPTTALNTRNTGEYVTFAGETWRIVRTENGATRLIMNNNYRENGEEVRVQFGANNFNTANGIGQYLNTHVLTTAFNQNQRNVMLMTDFYVNPYTRGQNPITTVLSQTSNRVQAQIGLPTIGDLMSSRTSPFAVRNSFHSWMINPDGGNAANGWFMGLGNSQENLRTHWLGFRPVITLNSSVTITGGAGTPNSPYALSH